jgi:serine/threonine protein kinase
MDASVLSEINRVHCGLKRSKIGKYESLSKTATGVMEAVYKARDTETRRPVILKTINVGLVAHPGLLERFYQEARFAASLQLDGPNAEIYAFNSAVEEIKNGGGRAVNPYDTLMWEPSRFMLSSPDERNCRNVGQAVPAEIPTFR